MERVDELSSLLHSMPSRLASFLFSPFLSFFSRTNADNSLYLRLPMERRHIERSPTAASTCFPVRIVIIPISTRPELGGLRESSCGLVNRKIRHKARREILFSHKKEKAQGGVVGFTQWPGENGRDIRGCTCGWIGIRTYLALGRIPRSFVLRPAIPPTIPTDSSQYTTTSTLCCCPRFLGSNNIPPALVNFHAFGADLAIG